MIAFCLVCNYHGLYVLIVTLDLRFDLCLNATRFIFACLRLLPPFFFVMLCVLPSTLPSIVFDLNSLGSTRSSLLFSILSFQVAMHTLLLIPLLIASLVHTSLLISACLRLFIRLSFLA